MNYATYKKLFDHGKACILKIYFSVYKVTRNDAFFFFQFQFLEKFCEPDEEKCFPIGKEISGVVQAGMKNNFW